MTKSLLKSGAITPKNAFDMISNMGININYDEARVLVASVDIDKSGDLSLNEFMDLIFNSTDALNVNLKDLPRKYCFLIFTI